MNDVYEILRQKENDIVRVRKEVQALRFVAPLLSDSSDAQVLEPETGSDSASVSVDNNLEEQNATQSEESPESSEVGQAIPPRRSRLRNLLGLAAGE